MLKNCKICNKVFDANRAILYCSDECKREAQYQMKYCVICNKEFKTIYAKTCSKECQIKLTKQVNLERFGTEYSFQSEAVKAKIKNTLLERLGVDNASKSEVIKQKKKNTCLKNNGVEHPAHCPEILSKIKQTNIKKYGVDNPLKSPEIKEKAKKTNLKKYGVENPAQCDKVKAKILNTNKTKYKRNSVRQTHITNFENFNRDFVLKNFTTNKIVTLRDRIRFKEYFNISSLDNALKKLKEWNIECEVLKNISMGEIKIFDFLVQKFPEFSFTQSNRGLIINPENNKPLEIDIIARNKQGVIICGIEYNGIAFHDKENPIRENLKSQLCVEKGFELFHIWEDSVIEDLQKVLEFLEIF